MNVIFTIVVVVVVAYVVFVKANKNKPYVKTKQAHKSSADAPRVKVLRIKEGVRPKCRPLAKSSSKPPKSQPNVGQIKAGEYGERKVESVLATLNDYLDGYIATSNIRYNNQQFECDFLIQIKGGGLVLLEVKHFAGEIFCTGERVWKQIKSGDSEFEQGNASLQVERTSLLLGQLLSDHGFVDTKPLPVVVFSHDAATIKRHKTISPQTEVLRLDMLANWIKDRVCLEKHTALDVKRFQRMCENLKYYEKPYERIA